MNKPIIVITTIVESQSEAQQMGYGRKPTKKRMVISVPGIKPNDEVDIGITKHNYVSTSTRIRDVNNMPEHAPLTLEVLNQGSWTEREGAWQYSVVIDVESERDSFNVDIIVQADDSEIKYRAKGYEGALDVNTQERVRGDYQPNLFTSRVN